MLHLTTKPYFSQNGETIVVEKTDLRRNQCKGCENRPLHVGASFDKLYIVRYRSADVNILGNTRLIARKSMRIYVRKDR